MTTPWLLSMSGMTYSPVYYKSMSVFGKSGPRDLRGNSFKRHYYSKLDLLYDKKVNCQHKKGSFFSLCLQFWKKKKRPRFLVKVEDSVLPFLRVDLAVRISTEEQSGLHHLNSTYFSWCQRLQKNIRKSLWYEWKGGRQDPTRTVGRKGDR